MRTAHWPYFIVYGRGGAPAWGSVLAWGVYLPGGCTCLTRGVPAQGVYLPRRVYLPRGCTCPGVYLPEECTCPGTPPMDRILDTRFWKYYLAPTSLRVVKIKKLTCIQSGRRERKSPVDGEARNSPVDGEARNNPVDGEANKTGNPRFQRVR